MILIDTLQQSMMSTLLEKTENATEYAQEEFSRVSQETNTSTVYLGCVMTGIVGYVTKDLWTPYLVRTGKVVYYVVSQCASKVIVSVQTLGGTVVGYMCYVYNALYNRWFPKPPTYPKSNGYTEYREFTEKFFKDPLHDFVADTFTI